MYLHDFGLCPYIPDNALFDAGDTIDAASGTPRILLDSIVYGRRAHLLPVKEKTPSLARKIARLVLIAARAQAKLRVWFAVFVMIISFI